MSYNISRKTSGDFDSVVARVKDALKTEGFGVLTEIDVAGTLKAKIDKDFRPYRRSPSAPRTPSTPPRERRNAKAPIAPSPGRAPTNSMKAREARQRPTISASKGPLTAGRLAGPSRKIGMSGATSR
ncbi:MAG TPA: DUF302 domain-containing protein [Roseiarcus sp.]|nr:DUF302 domain-containing protein [Roseiarcus sp.]